MQPKWTSAEYFPKAREKAISKDMTPISVNPDKQTAEFIGSTGEQYQTSLIDCDCGSTNWGKYPCKHMVRLAMELSLIPNENMQSDINAPLSRLYHTQILNFIDKASYPEVMEFFNFLIKLSPKTPEYEKYISFPQVQFLLDTSKKKVKRSKLGTKNLNLYFDKYASRLGYEFLNNNSINTNFYPSEYSLIKK